MAVRGMNGISYNIPTDLVSEYRDRQVIVRSHDPAEIVRKLSEEAALDNVQFVQLLSTDAVPAALDQFANWDCGVPLDIALRNPEAEYRLLYNFSKLAGTRPIRVSVAVKPGFKKAVKLALALHFAIKLDVGQPDNILVEDLSEVLDLYLHRSNVSEPVEFFHSVFLFFYRQEEINLWIVQEEDPDHYRFIDDSGVEHLSTRFGGITPQEIGSQRLSRSSADQYSLNECDMCEFSTVCGGYFKWPDRSYDCGGVKSIFGTLKEAAAELREDVARSGAMQKGEER